MIPLKDQEAIQQKFALELASQVKIDLFTERNLGLSVPGKQPCQTCKPTQEMLQELAGLSDLVSLRVHYLEEKPEEAAKFGVQRVPGIVMRGRVLQPRRAGETQDEGEPARDEREPFVTYYGIPAGTEFAMFLECIVDISRGETLLAEESVEALANVAADVSIKVFVTPTCPYCPQMMRLAYQMALLSPHIHAEAIEVNEFPDLADRYHVQAVPLTVINDTVAIPGAVNEKDLVERVVKIAAKSAPAEPGAKTEPIERGKERSSGLIIP